MIACLGYGSLVWDPRELPLAGDWRPDGPELPVEFARQARDDRLTLVVVEEAGIAPSRSLWAPVRAATVAEAKSALAAREGCRERWIAAWPGGEADRAAGHWTPGPAAPGYVAVSEWARGRGLEGVLWAALPYGFRDSRGELPGLEEAAAFLRELSGEALRNAEEYVRLAPAQTRTPWRRRLEEVLGNRIHGQDGG